MVTTWKGTLLDDAKEVGYTVDSERTDSLYVRGVPYTRDDGGENTFDLEIPRRNGSDHGESHQAFAIGWEGKTVKTPTGNIPGGTGRVHISLKKTATEEYEDIFEQALFYIQKLGGAGGKLAASPEEEWKEKVRKIRIAVIGAGGTGMHLVDTLSKCNVAIIEVWDGDTIEDRNTWRWPGSQSRWSDLEGEKKAEASSKEYSNARTIVKDHNEMVTESNVREAIDADYVFVAVDCNEARRTIVHACAQTKTPCIDVGMGVKIKEGRLEGSVRAHLYADGVDTPYRTPDSEGAQEAYEATEVPEANALNAAMAVTEWRRMTGQYRAHEKTRTMVQYNLEWACVTQD